MWTKAVFIKHQEGNYIGKMYILSPVAMKKGTLESLLDLFPFILATFTIPGCFLCVNMRLSGQWLGWNGQLNWVTLVDNKLVKLIAN